ncbi:MAG TPA: energy transducer TonB [Candidatus Baltobacteraceae bacterium]|nr:energy transducer TonB [Candidatus Baltobacteraceae bacterium]
MTKTQNAPARERFVSRRTIFLAAIAISLLVHLFFAGYLPWKLGPVVQPEERMARVRMIKVSRITPPPPPPPTPQPTPAAKSSVQPPTLTPKTTGKPAALHNVVAPVRALTPAPKPLLTPTPSPRPSVTPALGPCGGHKDVDPAVQTTPDPADIPPEARASKVTGTAQIKVTLDAQGHVTATAVAQSSGNTGLDGVAAQLAREATYSPKYVNCRAVAGEFLFSVHFSAI